MIIELLALILIAENLVNFISYTGISFESSRPIGRELFVLISVAGLPEPSASDKFSNSLALFFINNI